jgi:hypothetical protein
MGQSARRQRSTSAPRTASGRANRTRGAFVLWHRLKTNIVGQAQDTRNLTVLLLYSMRGELTDRHAAAGLKVAEIYQAFERHKLKRRTAASPGYQRSFGDPTAGEDDLDPEALARLEKKIGRDAKAWKRLQDIIDKETLNPRRARELLERVCVENRQPLDSELNDLRHVLEVVAAWQAKGERAQLPTVSVAVTANRRPREQHQAKARRERAHQIDKAAWIDCTRQMLAGARAVPPSDAELEDLWRGYLNRKAFELAKGDRISFRRDKERKRA